MKVLHVIGEASFGGIARLVYTLVLQQMNRKEVLPAILLTGMKGEHLQEYRDLGIEILCTYTRSGWSVSYRKYRLTRNIYKQFDIIHFHYFNPLLAWCAVRSGKPIVYTEHGNFGFGRKRTLSDLIKSRLLSMFLNHYVHQITFNSAFTQRFAASRYGLNRSAARIVYNGVDIHKISGNPSAVDEETKRHIEGRFVVGTSSRFAGFKRIDRLIAAYARQFGESSDTILLLVGDGELRDNLERQVDKLGISDSVWFTGFRSNVHDYQSVMDVCVYPSENEPFGLVAVESLMLGKPTLVFDDGGGIKEIVEGISRPDIVSGIEQLSGRLDYYYRKYGSSNHLLEAGRIDYAKRFNHEVMEAAFLDVYRDAFTCVE